MRQADLVFDRGRRRELGQGHAQDQRLIAYLDRQRCDSPEAPVLTLYQQGAGIGGTVRLFARLRGGHQHIGEFPYARPLRVLYGCTE